MTAKIRVLLVDDQPLLREGMRLIFELRRLIDSESSTTVSLPLTNPGSENQSLQMLTRCLSTSPIRPISPSGTRKSAPSTIITRSSQRKGTPSRLSLEQRHIWRSSSSA